MSFAINNRKKINLNVEKEANKFFYCHLPALSLIKKKFLLNKKIFFLYKALRKQNFILLIFIIYLQNIEKKNKQVQAFSIYNIFFCLRNFYSIFLFN